MNQVTLIGRLGDDVALNHTQTGKPVANFSLATDSANEKPDWHRIVVWDKQAENAAKYLSKGKKVAIVGRLSYRPYTDKNGVNHIQAEITAHTLEFLTPKDETAKPPQAAARQQPIPQSQYDEEIPF